MDFRRREDAQKEMIRLNMWLTSFETLRKHETVDSEIKVKGADSDYLARLNLEHRSQIERASKLREKYRKSKTVISELVASGRPLARDRYFIYAISKHFPAEDTKHRGKVSWNDAFAFLKEHRRLLPEWVDLPNSAKAMGEKVSRYIGHCEEAGVSPDLEFDSTTYAVRPVSKRTESHPTAYRVVPATKTPKNEPN